MPLLRLTADATLALLLATKLADCASTHLRIRGAGDETNGLARALMRRLGVGPTIWAVGGLAGTVAIAAWWPTRSEGSAWYALSYVLLGLPIAGVQASVAWANWTGRMNPVTRVVARLHGLR